ncbi:MAG TPA: carbohydrate binding domain-containing protein, partial [Dehalococcoidia bacterium]|nr:carbohydrate binding domain-containing protein [Dehalococcoidia bacterium]
MRALPRLAAVFAVICGAVLPGAPATAVELVRNGGFEDDDLSSWRFRGLSYERVAAPDAPEGAYVVRISIDPTRGDPQWVAQQALPFVTPGATYVFGAALAVSGGTAQARALIEWMDADGGFGNSVLTSVTAWTARADGVFQSVEARAVAPSLARSALIRIEARNVTSGVEVRADAIRVDGPPPASPTPTGTPTDEPAPTPTLTPTPTVSPSPTVTPTPGPGEGLRNPGFEEVADGVPVAWQKYGGELVTTARARSGERAGLLRSDSDATKWAYQTVLVEGGAWYEFDAWVLSEDPAVERALLRVSWYASPDGS